MRYPALLAMTLGLLLAGGCASMQDRNAMKESTDWVIDYNKVAAVEYSAARTGTRVIWVNYPKKRVDDTSK